MTIELPDDLLRRIKVQAALTDQRLKVLVPQILEAGLRQYDRTASPKPGSATKPAPHHAESRLASRRRV